MGIYNTQCSSGISLALSQALNSQSDLPTCQLNDTQTKTQHMSDCLNISWKQRHFEVKLQKGAKPAVVRNRELKLMFKFDC